MPTTKLTVRLTQLNDQQWIGYIGQVLNGNGFMPLLAEISNEPSTLFDSLWNAAKKRNMTCILG